jgi:hypothetical protein
MNKRIYVLLGLLFAAGLTIVGCSESHEKKVDAAQDNAVKANKELIDAQVDFTNEWQQFKDAAHVQVKANQDRIEKFKAEMKTADGKYKVKYEKQVGILEQKNIELGKRVDAFKYNGKSSWDEFKRDFNHDADDLGKTLKSLLPGKN